jgi:hypothetical protein
MVQNRPLTQQTRSPDDTETRICAPETLSPPVPTVATAHGEADEQER